MITFGNEVKPRQTQTHTQNPNSPQNSSQITRPNNHQNSFSITKQNSNSVTKKPTDLEKLQYKYRKLDKENKKLKSNLDEMMFLSKNLQSSLTKTEGLYATIHNSMKEGKNEDLSKDNISQMEWDREKVTKNNKVEDTNVTYFNNLSMDNFCIDLISKQIPPNVNIFYFIFILKFSF